RPIIVTLVLITVVTHWNNFMWPMVITSGPEWRVITVATSALQSQYNNNWTLVMAGTPLAMLPLVLLMIAFQKQIIRSVRETTLRRPVAQGPSAGPNPAGELCNAVVIDPLTRNFAELGAGHARAMGTGGIDLCEVGVSSGHNHHIAELASDTPRTSAWGSPPPPPPPRSALPLPPPRPPRSALPLPTPRSPRSALPLPTPRSPLPTPRLPLARSSRSDIAPAPSRPRRAEWGCNQPSLRICAWALSRTRPASRRSSMLNRRSILTSMTAAGVVGAVAACSPSSDDGGSGGAGGS